jgi:RHS repeat-associated protein
LYEFDNLNRLTSETIDGVNRSIGYDKIDQVKSVTGSNSEAYTYDANGNRTNNGYVTGANNQLVSDGTYNYNYDAKGNRTKRTNIATSVVDEYVWDYRNRLTTVTTKDGAGVVTQTVGYEYDVDDQRVSKTVNGVVEKYIIDRNQIAYVTDGSGTQTFHYLYGTNVDAVMAQDSPTGMVWSLSDRLGSVNLLADAGGVVVDKRSFDSFGRILSETNPGLSFRYGYTGRETDGETGLDYYRARYYDAANGRFISVDPAGFGAGDTNLYRYVGNSSTMYTDPSGKILPILALAAAFATGVELAVEAAVLFGLGAAAINVVRQDIEIAQGSSDGFKLDQFAQSAAIGTVFGAATPFLGAGVLTGIGALGTGLGLLSAKNEYDNHHYGTAAFDALTAIPFGFVGKLATEKFPQMFEQMIPGKQPGGTLQKLTDAQAEQIMGRGLGSSPQGEFGDSSGFGTSLQNSIHISRNQLGELLGSGGNKDVYAFGENQAVGILKEGKKDSLIIDELQILKKLTELGIPTVKARLASIDGNAGMMLERFAQGSKDIVKLKDGTIRTVGTSSLLNQNSINDLTSIRKLMVDNKIKIDDLQFLISSDGKVVVADPLKVVTGEKPSKNNLRMIDLLIQSAKENL